jgi:hypothetical protein
MNRDEERDVLRLVVVDSPCTADWRRMRGNDRVRFCGTCQLNVYDLSGMSQGQAAALVASREGRLCVRFFQRPDGTMVTRDCGAAGRRLARALFTGICAFIALVLAGSAAGIETWMTDVRWPWRSEALPVPSTPVVKARATPAPTPTPTVQEPPAQRLLGRMRPTMGAPRPLPVRSQRRG